MNPARTTRVLKEDSDYFVAELDNGAMRFGIKDVAMVDLPPGHDRFDWLQSLPDAECFDLACGDFADEMIHTGLIPLAAIR